MDDDTSEVPAIDKLRKRTLVAIDDRIRQNGYDIDHIKTLLREAESEVDENIRKEKIQNLSKKLDCFEKQASIYEITETTTKDDYLVAQLELKKLTRTNKELLEQLRSLMCYKELYERDERLRRQKIIEQGYIDDEPSGEDVKQGTEKKDDKETKERKEIGSGGKWEKIKDRHQKQAAYSPIAPVSRQSAPGFHCPRCGDGVSWKRRINHFSQQHLPTHFILFFGHRTCMINEYLTKRRYQSLCGNRLTDVCSPKTEPLSVLILIRETLGNMDRQYLRRFASIIFCVNDTTLSHQHVDHTYAHLQQRLKELKNADDEEIQKLPVIAYLRLKPEDSTGKSSEESKKASTDLSINNYSEDSPGEQPIDQLVPEISK